MITLEKIDACMDALKTLKASRKKYDKISEKLGQSAPGELSVKQCQKLNADINWLAMEIDKEEHFVHMAMVQAGLGCHFKDSYYGVIQYSTSAWHNYTFERKRPVRG